MAVNIDKLNAAQKQAVTHDMGPALLVAGAGTGKTTVITNRIAWLIGEGKAKPEEILAVTFTEKAASEMEERVDQLLPLGYTDLWIHTFHAFCQRILTEHAIDVGLSNEFRVMDQTAIWMLIRENLEKFDLDYYKPLGNPTRFVHALLSHFSRCKDEGIYPEDYVKYAEELKLDSDQASDREAAGSEAKRIQELAGAYHVYQQLLLDKNVFDFGDLINFALKLFTERPKILEKYQKHFKYILVDEFQDTNWAQYQLLKLLAAPKNNIMVVGDDDQSIYKFRGASFSNIVLFKKEYKDSASIYLIDNYRSGQKILDLAYDFIQLNNPDRLEVKLSKGKENLSKKLTSHVVSDGEVTVLQYSNADDEVRGVIEKISELRKSEKDFSWNHVAILVRANEQAQRFVRYFRSLNVPHQFMAAKGLYSQDIIMAILSYLKLLDNYHESEALYKVLSLPTWGMLSDDLMQLNHTATKKSWSLWHTIQHYQSELKLTDTSTQALATFVKLVEEHTAQATKLAPSVLIYKFIEDSGYLKMLTIEDTQYNREQILFLNQFYKKIRTWEEENLGGGIKEFIDYINLELESGERGSLEQDIEEGPEQVKISTIHSAKGLEYRYVFIVGLVHLRFPTRERKDPITIPEELIKDVLPEGDAHLQEERRLMYVALTRAKDKVFLSYAAEYGTIKKKPSVFLSELGLDAERAIEKVSAEYVLTDAPEPLETKYRLPNRFSFTQLRAFQTCPKQYYYAHVIRIPGAGKAVFSFGKVMHAVLERFFSLVKERSNATQADLFGTAKATTKKKPVTEKELLDLYDELWEEDWFMDDEHKKKYYTHGKELLKVFYKGLGDAVPVPVGLEQKFTMKIGETALKGVIDRIDEDAKEGEWKLIDYKTGSPPKKDTLAPKDKEQLLIYQLAAEQVFQKKVTTLSLHFLENNKAYDFIGTAAELIKVKQSVTDIIDQIKSSQFETTPGFWCKTCDYRFICPAAQR